MIERLQGHVEKVTFVRNIAPNLDQCEIQIDFDVLTIFYDANELVAFTNQDVYYTVRPDIVNGQQVQVICELALLSTIQTVSASENIKLIPEGTKRTVCNLDSKTIRFGEFYPNVVALMSKWVMGSSSKAKWYDCTCIDINSREFEVRLFNAEAGSPSMDDRMNSNCGRYVNFDLESTKYGYQTKEINPLPNAVEESPEVIVAKEIVQNTILADSGLAEYDRKYGFINHMSSVIDGEPGYGLVRIASELYMINAIENISVDLDIRAMRRAAICSRGYLLPHKAEWSRPMLNTNKVLQVGELKTDRELISITDVLTSEEASSTKQTYIKIRGLVDDIINIRRGVKDEKEITAYTGISTLFNGLL